MQFSMCSNESKYLLVGEINYFMFDYLIIIQVVEFTREYSNIFRFCQTMG